MKTGQAPSALLLKRFSSWVSSHMGLYFPPDRYPDLVRGVSEACANFDFSCAEMCMEGLMSRPLSREQSEILASHLTIGETYFFRESKTFQALKTEVLPELIRQRQSAGRSLRIWSAGCATGEEPYSLAILLSELLRDLGDWQVLLLATDINPQALQKATTGVYTEWSFRDTPATIKQLYFREIGAGRYELIPEIRHMVTFTYLNLAEDVYPSLLNNTTAMDLVLCRNVLMYFMPEISGKVLHRFSLALVEGGWLSISPCDTFHLPEATFAKAAAAEVSLYQKRTPLPEPSSRRLPPRAVPQPATTSKRPPEPRRATRPQRLAELLRQSSECMAQGRYTEAAAFARQLLVEHPGSRAALEILARATANQGQLDEALRWCQQALGKDQLSPHLHFLHGTVLQEQGQLAEAIVSLKRVVYLAPSLVLAYYALGNLYHQLGQEAEAQAQFQRALALLQNYGNDQLLPEAEGMTAGRLRDVLHSTLQTEPSV